MSDDAEGFLAGFQVERRSTAKRVADDLHGMILSGEFRPGAPVREQAVSERLNVSRQTVREAIQWLVREGLLVHEPYKGTLVRTLTREDVEDVYKLRAVIELAAVDAAVAGERERQDAIVAAGDAVVAAFRQGTYFEFLDADYRYHQALVGSLESVRVNGLYESLFGELMLMFSLSDRGQPPADVAELHRAIAEAIRRRDARRAKELVKTHLERALNDALAQLQEQ